MECVRFGPGTIDVAHKPNEHLPIAEWERAVPIVEALVRRMCTS
jgi:acetylornithine deacetylase/succinyl-diaminopimelate desuccinylase-like protein